MPTRIQNEILAGKKAGTPFKVRGDYTRVKIWSALIEQDLPQQTPGLIAATGFSYDKIKSWLDAWAKHGYVRKEALDKSPTGGTRFTYQAIERSPLPPTINLKGIEKPIEYIQLIWQAVRQLSAAGCVFTPDDVLEHVKINHSVEANRDWTVNYLRNLHNTGYLQSKPSSGRELHYTLTYNTGPLPPNVLRNKHVFDPNLEVMVS